MLNLGIVYNKKIKNDFIVFKDSQLFSFNVGINTYIHNIIKTQQNEASYLSVDC